MVKTVTTPFPTSSSVASSNPMDNIMCDLRIVVQNLSVICVRFIYDAKVPAAQDIMNLVQEVSF